MPSPELDPPSQPRPGSEPAAAAPSADAVGDKRRKRRHRKADGPQPPKTESLAQSATGDAPSADAAKASDGWNLMPLQDRDDEGGVSEKLLGGVLVLALLLGFGIVVFKKIATGETGQDATELATVFGTTDNVAPTTDAPESVPGSDPFATAPPEQPQIAAAAPTSEPSPPSDESFGFDPLPAAAPPAVAQTEPAFDARAEIAAFTPSDAAPPADAADPFADPFADSFATPDEPTAAVAEEMATVEPAWEVANADWSEPPPQASEPVADPFAVVEAQIDEPTADDTAGEPFAMTDFAPATEATTAEQVPLEATAAAAAEPAAADPFAIDDLTPLPTPSEAIATQSPQADPFAMPDEREAYAPPQPPAGLATAAANASALAFEPVPQQSEPNAWPSVETAAPAPSDLAAVDAMPRELSPSDLNPNDLIPNDLAPADLTPPGFEVVEVSPQASPLDLTPMPAATTAVPAHSIAGGRSHTLAPGENFWTISKEHYGTVKYFGALAYHNRRQVPDDRRMRPGTVVELPSVATLDAIMAQFGGTVTPAAALAHTRPADAATDRATPSPAPTPRAASGLTLASGERTASDDAAALPGFFVRDDGVPCYRIGPNETLSGIAQETLGRASRWRQIAAMNVDAVPDPNRLRPGTVVVLPHDAASVRHAVLR